MAYKSEDFTLYDILVEAECLFSQKAETYKGYREGEYWGALLEAARGRRISCATAIDALSRASEGKSDE